MSKLIKNNAIDEAITVIKAQYDKMCEAPISAEELNKGKEYIKGKMILKGPQSLDLLDNVKA